MKDAEVMERVGARIRQLRMDQGMSQQEFAAKLDYEKSNASRMESGKVNLRIVTLAKVAKVLKVKISELLEIE